MKVQCMGVGFDHQQEYRRTWQIYAMSCFALIFSVLGYNVRGTDFSKEKPVEIYSAIAYHVSQVAPSFVIVISFTIWLNNIHKRLALLNLHLRFSFHSFGYLNVFSIDF